MMDNSVIINFFANTANALKIIDNFKEKVNNATNSIKSSLAGKFGALASGFIGVKAIVDVYEKTKQLSNFSQQFSLPIEEVSKFANVLSFFGGSTQDSINTIGSLEQAIVDLRTTGGGAFKEVASEIALSLQKQDGSFKSSIEVLNELRNKFKGMRADAQLKVAQKLGISDPASLKLLRASDKEYAEMSIKANKFGLVNAGIQKNVEALQRTIAFLKQAWFSFGAGLLGTVLVPLEKITNVLFNIKDVFEKNKDLIIPALAGILAMLYPIITSTLAWAAATLIAVAPWLLLGLVVAGLIYIIKKLYDNCEGFRNFIKGAFNFVIEFFKEMGTMFKDIFNWINKILDKIPFIKKIKSTFGDVKEELDVNNNFEPIPTTRQNQFEPIPTTRQNQALQNNIFNNNQANTKQNKTINFGNIVVNGSNDPKKTGFEIKNQLSALLNQQAGGF